MIRIRPSAPREVAEGYTRRVAHFDSAAGVGDLWFTTPAHTRPLSDDWLLPVAVVIGMALGEDVRVSGCVSERLLAAMDEIQRVSILREKEGLRKVRITADEVAPPARAERPRVVACFSGGVDAFYTAVDPELRIDEHLYVHGLDGMVSDERMFAYALPHLTAASTELGRNLRLAETNWREVVEPLAGLRFCTLVPMLYAIAHLMASDLSRLVVPQTWDELFEVTDPSSLASYAALWSTTGLQTVEHGHVTRFEKVRHLLRSEVAMRYLRVCWERRDPVYNCGRCEKCMRMRIHLKLADAEGRCETLPRRLRMDEVRFAPAFSQAHGYYLKEALAEADARGMEVLADALRFHRDRPDALPTWSRDPVARLRAWFTKQNLSFRRRLFDRSLRRLKQRCGHDHLFYCLGPAPCDGHPRPRPDRG